MCFFNDTATTEIYTLSLHDALPISGYAVDVCLLIDAWRAVGLGRLAQVDLDVRQNRHQPLVDLGPMASAVLAGVRSEEHTSELQSRQSLVCRLLLDKKTPLNV